MTNAWQRSKTGSPVVSEQSFTQLVEEFQVPIFNLCYRILGNPHEAEDAAQETLVQAYFHYQQYDPARSIKTWLFSIAHHKCIDLLRKRRRAVLISVDDFAESNIPAVHPSSTSPEEAFHQQEDSRYLQKLLSQIKPKYRNAVLLRYWFDLSYEEIAQITRCSVTAVKSRLFRAKKQLSELHAGENYQTRPAAVFSSSPEVYSENGFQLLPTTPGS
jgi:RNA polymerase sigma-70 factor (ECF subfamily)